MRSASRGQDCLGTVLGGAPWRSASSLAPRASVPTSKAGDNVDTGFHALGFFGLNIPGLPVSLRATFTFNRFDLRPEGLDLEDLEVDTSTSTRIRVGLNWYP